MDGNELQLPWELNCVLEFFHAEFMASSSSSNPLFSCIVTVYTLILLYFPQAFRFFLSPVFILTSLLLLFLLRLGAVQRVQDPNPDANDRHERVETKENVKEDDKFGLLTQVDKWVETGFTQNPSKSDFEVSFVEWNVRAPLEVIYEAYEEGKEEEDDEENDHRNETRICSGLERYPSLSMYYPETDSDSSSSDGDFSLTGEWDSPESVCFKWEEEDRDGLLIEIALDHNNNDNNNKHSGLGLDMDLVEEDNLIEIDISPPKNDAF